MDNGKLYYLYIRANFFRNMSFFDLNFMECIFVSCVEILVYNFYMLNIIKSDIDYLTSRVVDMDERFMEEKIKEYY